MRTLIIILVAVAAGLDPAVLADPYNDLAAQGYRWVIVDGPYACPTKDDLREISRHRTDLMELRMVQELRAFYLIQGGIVQVDQEDAAAAMSQIHVPEHPMKVWTLTRFLSRKPIRDTFGIKTPTTYRIWCRKNKWAFSLQPRRIQLRRLVQPQRPMLVLRSNQIQSRRISCRWREASPKCSENAAPRMGLLQFVERLYSTDALFL